MKLRVDVDGESYALEIGSDGIDERYSLTGATHANGRASVVELRPGMFSVLLGHKSFVVCISQREGLLEVSAANQRHVLSVADARDRAGGSKKAAALGPIAIRAQMPGKIIKVLAKLGAAVRAGEGVIVVEAMKMQNEMKSPKAGVVSSIRVQEGATVAAGETMMVIE